MDSHVGRARGQRPSLPFPGRKHRWGMSLELCQPDYSCISRTKKILARLRGQHHEIVFLVELTGFRSRRNRVVSGGLADTGETRAAWGASAFVLPTPGNLGRARRYVNGILATSR